MTLLFCCILQAFEDLIGTISDTVTLQGKQIILATGGTSRFTQDDDFIALTQIVSNHSLSIENVQSQV